MYLHCLCVPSYLSACLPAFLNPVTGAGPHFSTGSGTVKVATSILATAPAASVSPWLAKFLMFAPPLAAQIVFLAPMQSARTFKKEGTTGDVSPVNLAAMCVNGIVWISYGAMRSDPTIWVPNITAFLFGSYYLYTFNQYKAKGASVDAIDCWCGVASMATGGVIASLMLHGR